MYKIKKDDIEGWVYSKYLVDTKELAEQNYNESNTYDTHKDRKYYRELYGGKASTLDYYPYEKVEFDNNPLMKKAKAMYLNAGKNVRADIDSYIKVATSSGVNTIVVDLKDGALAYPMEVAKEYSKKAYEIAINILVSSVFNASFTITNHIKTSIKPIILAYNDLPLTVIIVLKVPSETSRILTKKIFKHKNNISI